MWKASLAALGAASYDAEWAEYQQAQGEVTNDEPPAAFRENVDRVREHNAKEEPYTLAYTGPWAAYTREAYAELLTLHPYPGPPQGATYLGSHEPSGRLTAPDAVDWVEKGAVTAVKNQGHCGSCWAFSTTGSLEGAWQIATGKLVSLSEQELVDCSKNGNQGCGGGIMENGFEYLEDHNVCTEAAYPYTASDGQCGLPCRDIGVPRGGVTGYVDVTGGEAGLLDAVMQQPVSVAIEADQMSFQLYSSGVLTGRCGTKLDHGVLTVGFGTEGSRQYWKVKNSWGPSWGEAGYIRLERGNNQCGIGMQPTYPKVNGDAIAGSSTVVV